MFMPSVAEIATAITAMVTVVGVSVAATVYFSDGSSSTTELTEAERAANGPHRYVISDAYYLCRDHIDTAVSQKVRNINVDSHSSHYDENRNDNIIFIDLQLLDEKGEGRQAAAEDATIECRVSAADNEIKAFQVRKG